MKEPMLPGERPELLASSLNEIMRSMAAGLILAGKAENVKGVRTTDRREAIGKPSGCGGVGGMLEP